MKIKIDENYRVHICDALLGVQGESNSRKIHVEQPVVPGVIISVLRVLTGVMVTDMDGVEHPECVDIPTSGDGDFVVPAPALAHAGVVKMQWIASNGSGEIVAKSPVFAAMVAESLEDAQAIPDYDTIMSKLDEFTAYVATVQAEQAHLQEEQAKIEQLIADYGVYPGVSADAGNTLETRENGLYTSGGSGGSDIQIDTTLTKSGFAADAKSAGDKVRLLNTGLGMDEAGNLTKLIGLQSNISSLGTAVDNLSTALANVQNAMATKDDVSTVNRIVTSLQTDVNELKGISALLDTIVEV